MPGLQSDKIQVSFTTKTKFVVPSNPILVPIDIGRSGLSDIVNHLLSLPTPIPFDFLVEGAFLRSSIEKYLHQNKLSAESLLVLEYVESIQPPESIGGYEHDDWIASVRSDELILTGCYDGGIKIWNRSNACLHTITTGDAPVKSVEWIKNGEKTCFAGGMMDGRIVVWELAEKEPTAFAELSGHSMTVESLRSSNDKSRICSASWDGKINVWDLPLDLSVESTVEQTSSKKRKVEKSLPRVEPSASLEGHVGNVNAAQFFGSKVISCGNDHSIRFWDVANAVNERTLNSGHVVLDIDSATSSGLVLSGHSDNIIRLWDARDESSHSSRMRFLAHKNWTSAVQWSPSNPFYFASASYDASVIIWDIRSSTPVSKIITNESNEKLLCLDWDGDLIFAGGESKVLGIHQIRS